MNSNVKSIEMQVVVKQQGSLQNNTRATVDVEATEEVTGVEWPK